MRQARYEQIAVLYQAVASLDECATMSGISKTRSSGWMDAEGIPRRPAGRPPLTPEAIERRWQRRVRGLS